jgi:hypothetical protein
MTSIGSARVLFSKYSAPNLQREEGWIKVLEVEKKSTNWTE